MRKAPVCIARVGRVVAAKRGRGTVEFFDGRSLEEVDVSMAGAGRGAYVEVFGNLALSVLSAKEARARMKEWEEVRRAAALALAEGRRR